MRTVTLTLVLAGLALVATALAEEAARPEKAPLNLPAVWKAVSPEVRVQTVLVAQTDAARQLLSRLYEVKLTAETSIVDFVLADDRIHSAVAEKIKGVKLSEPRYTDDLTVEVEARITIREVVETINKTIRKFDLGQGKIKVEDLSNVKQETLDSVLAAVGVGAVPGSKGYDMVLAKRAAEVDAYRKLVQAVFGQQIFSDTEVRNLMLKNDRVVTSVAASLKGAKVTKVQVREDNACEVTVAVKLREVIETIEYSVKRYVRDGKNIEEKLSKMKQEVQEKTVEATGFGAPPKKGAEAPVGVAREGKPFEEEITTIRRIISREVGAF
jgi:hypothetical protein